MNTHNIKIADLQETKLIARSKTSTPFQSLVGLDKEYAGLGGGIAFLIHPLLHRRPAKTNY